MFLKFSEPFGPHSGEDLATAFENMLIELDLECKVVTITGDNASHNGRVASLLFQDLTQQLGADPLFRNGSSYARCFSHILNHIVKDISFKRGNLAVLRKHLLYVRI